MKLSGLLVLAALATPAWGGPREDRLVVELDGDAPFSASELDTALRVRLDSSGEGVRVMAYAHDGAVTIAIGGRTRNVALNGQTGPAAARVVALAAIDLVLPDLASAPVATRDPDTIDDWMVHGITATRREAPPQLTVAVLGGAGMWSGAMASGSVEVSSPIGKGHTVMALELGGGHMFGGGLDLTAGLVRASIGMRRGAIELRGGATLAPITVGDGQGDSTVLFGAGVSARVRVPLFSTTNLVVAGGADAFATRTEYTRIDMPTYSTPWFAPWVAIGVEATP